MVSDHTRTCGPRRVGRTGELVVDGDERVVRREGARGTLPVHEQRARPGLEHVLLHLYGWVGECQGSVCFDGLLRLVDRLLDAPLVYTLAMLWETS